METNPNRPPAGAPIDDDLTAAPGRRAKGWNYAFVISWLGILALPFYNQAEPRLGGFPMFYWFQLFMVVVGAVITWAVFVATPAEGDEA